MHELITALAGFSGLFEEAVHGAGRTEVLAFVQQGGLYGGWRTILKTLIMQDGQHVGPFARAERACGAGPLRHRRFRHRRWGRAQDGTLPIEGSAGHREEIAGGNDTHGGGQMDDGIHQGFSSGPALGRGQPNSAPTFFWTSMTISALRSSSVKRSFSRRSFWFSSAIGLRLDLGPRLCGVKPLRMPNCRSRRQVTRWEE